MTLLRAFSCVAVALAKADARCAERIFSGSPWLFVQVAVPELRAEEHRRAAHHADRIRDDRQARAAAVSRRDDGQLDARDRPRVTVCRRLLGNDPEPTGTTAVATNPGYARLFAELGAGSLAVGIALVVLIPFLRKLITDKAETAPAVAPTPAGPAAAAV